MPLSVKRALKRAEYGLAMVGISLLVYGLAELVRADIYQAVERSEFSKLISSEGSAARTNSSKRAPLQPARGSAIGRVDIPRIALSTIIVEGDGARELEFAAGHIPGTAFPGEPGNIAIAGHRDTFFRPLRLIHKNDSITLTTKRGEFTYRVTSTEVVHPKDTQVLQGTSSETLTLVTCYPFYFIGSAPRRFIVHAERVPPSPKAPVD